jgi:hypothetical protein
MADVPDTIVLKRDRELEGREWNIWLRRGILTLIGALSIAALLNVFGQRTVTARADSPVADLTLDAPTTLRAGVLWQARFTIHAKQEIKDARLVLGGWARGQTINTIEPSPIGEASVDGRVGFDLGHVRVGHRYVLFMNFQTNPTYFGNARRTTDLYDGSTHLLAIDQSTTTYP